MYPSPDAEDARLDAPIAHQDLPTARRDCWLYQPGLVPYLQAWDWQKCFVRDLQANANHPDCLLLLQHPAVYTLGTGSSLAHLRFEPEAAPAPLHRIERGGEVTYHCPGQLVGYPLLNLRHYQTDLHWYLRQLEEVILQVLASYDLQGERIAGLTGVWVEDYKVAAIGIKVSRWITMHGFALNICPDLQGFNAIVPCGISDRPVGRLTQFIPDIDAVEVQNRVARSFATVFEVDFIEQKFTTV
jgi:lipoyl(octanoyl) transferase